MKQDIALNNLKKVYVQASAMLHATSRNASALRFSSINLYEKLKTNISQLTQKNNDVALEILLAFVYRDLGYAYLTCGKMNKSESVLMEGIDFIKTRGFEKQAIIPYVQSIIDLVICYNEQRMFPKSIELLKEAEEMCQKFEENEENHKALSVHDIFAGQIEMELGNGQSIFETLYTRCISYMAQTYQAMGNFKKFFLYSYIELKRMSKSKSSCDLELIEKSLMISDYFIKQNMFEESRKYLAAATSIIDKYNEMASKKDSKKNVKAKETCAKLGMAWGKYGLSLLLASMERCKKGDDYNFAEGFKDLKIDEDMPFALPDIPLDKYVKDIPTDYCRTFKDAKKIYVLLIKWLGIAKEFYNPHNGLLQYVDTMKDFARLYHYVAYFEEVPMNQYKMHKLRAKYLEDALTAINGLMFLPLQRECWSEAGFSYVARLLIKTNEMETNDNLQAKDNCTINMLIKKAMEHFKKIIASYQYGVWSLYTTLPYMPINDKKYLVISLYNMAQLHARLISPDDRDNLSVCLYYYRAYVKECTADEILAEEQALAIAESHREIKRLMAL
ncbi:KIF-binding protein-like [Haematobia irritans]|uniref:KIF-binding protein-like n=1 Tax=Haematobia irritans TaxID=7368 RepID=UPI003F4FA6EE